MKSTHTPGEWLVCTNKNTDSLLIRTEKRLTFIELPITLNEVNTSIHDKLKAEQLANAHLVAKALRDIQSKLDTLKGMAANKKGCEEMHNLIEVANKTAVDVLYSKHDF